MQVGPPPGFAQVHPGPAPALLGLPPAQLGLPPAQLGLPPAQLGPVPAQLGPRKSSEPLFTERHTLLSPEEVLKNLRNPSSFTDKVSDFAFGKGGEVYFYKSNELLNMKDWGKAGHIMKQVHGADKILSKEDPNQVILKRRSDIITQEKKTGDPRFKRYGWMLSEDSKEVLIQRPLSITASLSWKL